MESVTIDYMSIRISITQQGTLLHITSASHTPTPVIECCITLTISSVYTELSTEWSKGHSARPSLRKLYQEVPGFRLDKTIVVVLSVVFTRYVTTRISPLQLIELNNTTGMFRVKPRQFDTIVKDTPRREGQVAGALEGADRETVWEAVSNYAHWQVYDNTATHAIILCHCNCTSIVFTYPCANTDQMHIPTNWLRNCTMIAPYLYILILHAHISARCVCLCMCTCVHDLILCTM